MRNGGWASPDAPSNRGGRGAETGRSDFPTLLPRSRWIRRRLGPCGQPVQRNWPDVGRTGKGLPVGFRELFASWLPLPSTVVVLSYVGTGRSFRADPQTGE